MTRWLAAALLTVSLGLPWGTQQTAEADYSSRMVIPLFNGFAGGYTGLQTVPTYAGGTRTVTHVVIGSQHPARFGIVAAIAMLVMWGARARWWAAAVVVAELALAGGLGLTAGGVAAAWLAVLLLAGQAAFARRR